VISKADFNTDLNNQSISRVKKQQLLAVPEHEKQVYHEFEPISKEALDHTPSVIPDHYKSSFDIHQLVTDGPKGMDPCQTFDQRIFSIQRFTEIEKFAAKQLNV